MRNSKEVIEKKYNLTIESKDKIICNVCNYTWQVKRLRYNRNMSCPNCHPSQHGSSRGECYLYDLLLTTGQKIIHNDRTTLDGKELDIYFPELKFAIEYDGEYWHSKEEDEQKNKLCKEKGIVLLRINDKEFTKNPKSTADNIIEILNGDYNLNLKIDYSIKEVIRVSGKASKIICTDTGKIFNNYIEASKEVGCMPSYICNVCNGTFPHIKGFHFEYYKEKKEYKKTKPKFEYNEIHVECIETGEVFSSIAQIHKLGVKTIWDCVNGKQKSAGSLHWRKTDKEPTSTEETEKMLNKAESASGKQIICIETGEVFPSCQSAADYYSTTKEAFSAACRNNTSCMGKHWKYTGVETFFRRESCNVVHDGEIYSIKEASKKFGVCEGAIRRNCLGKTKTTKAGVFSYLNKRIREDNIKLKKVKNLNTGETYDSIKECAEKLNAPVSSIARVCRGERKSYKGIFLEYSK